MSKNISIIYPSGKVNQKIINDILKKNSWNIVFNTIPKTQDLNAPYLMGEDQERILLLTKAMEKGEILWAARGGYGASRIMANITPKKSIIGFSDITALLFLWHLNGLNAIHGPVVNQYPKLDNLSKSLLNSILQKGFLPQRRYELMSKTYYEDEIKAPVIGGNLTLISSLCGTKYMIPLDSKIFILEDISEPLYKVDRMITQLKHCAGLNKAKAIVIGEFTGLKSLEVVSLVLSLLPDVPIFYGFPIGHGTQNHPFVFGENSIIKDNYMTFSDFIL